MLPNPNAVKVQRANEYPRSPSNFLSNLQRSASSAAQSVSNSRSRPRTLSVNKQNNHHAGNNVDANKSSEMRNISFEWIEDQFSRGRADGGRPLAGATNQNSNNKPQHSQTCCRSAYQLDQLEYKNEFCANYMSKHLDIIQAYLNRTLFSNGNAPNGSPVPESPSASPNVDIETVLVSVAEMKKIRDILRGSLPFENSLNK